MMTWNLKNKNEDPCKEYFSFNIFKLFDKIDTFPISITGVPVFDSNILSKIFYDSIVS